MRAGGRILALALALALAPGSPPRAMLMRDVMLVGVMGMLIDQGCA